MIKGLTMRDPTLTVELERFFRCLEERPVPNHVMDMVRQLDAYEAGPLRMLANLEDAV